MKHTAHFMTTFIYPPLTLFMARLTVVKGHIAVGLWGQNLGRFFLLFENTF